jgi:hypothetical protein
MPIRFLVILLLTALALPLYAQREKKQVAPKTDSASLSKPTQEPPKDAARLRLESLPKKAAWSSAILPGLGQVQNKRWWKLPLIYGGFASFVIAYRNNDDQYHVFLNEIQYRLANNGNPGNPDFAGYSFEGLVRIKDNFRRNRELSIIGGVVLHAVNIIDAYVDAKFFRFDISENLSLQIRPSLQNQWAYSAMRPQPALSFKLSL